MPPRSTITDVQNLLTKSHPTISLTEGAVYTNNRSPISLVCSLHGPFQNNLFHLQNIAKPCPGCRGVRKTDASAGTVAKEALVTKFGAEVCSKYSLDNFEYKEALAKVTVVCPEHGPQLTSYAQMINTSAKTPCTPCNKSAKVSRMLIPPEEVQRQLQERVGDRRVELLPGYKSQRSKVKITCDVHGPFQTSAANILHRHTDCPACRCNSPSKPELEMAEFVKTLGVQVEHSVWLSFRKEADIFVPSLKLAIEYDGIFWHNELHRSKNYHKEATDKAQAAGIRMVHVFEDEWLYRKDMVKHRLTSLCGKHPRIGARSCEVRDVPFQESVDFLEKYHSQGQGRPTKVRKGLYHKGALVALLTLSPARFGGGKEAEAPSYEVFRYCTSLSVAGGFTKLLKYALQGLPPGDVTSYSDRRWGYGEVYLKAGFTHHARTEPGYFWAYKDRRYGRQEFMKSKLKERWPDIYSDDKTEAQMCHEKSFYRIYDCGHDLWLLPKEKAFP
jgi:hypothetical protein